MQELILDGHKLAWHRQRVDALLRGERVAPITVDCALTRRCTYRCGYCYGALQANDEKRMTRDVIFRFLDDAAEIGVKAVSLVSDGESTCSPHLYDAILRGRQNGLDMALGTNGYLLRDERLADILPALTYLRFNFSAGDRARYAQIHGCEEHCFDKVVETVARCVRIKKDNHLAVTLGLQMVLLPEYADQVLPLAHRGRDLGVDYLVIKHCSDDERSTLGVQYDKYEALTGLLKQAQALSTPAYQVRVKWSKILSGGKRCYPQCYGPALILQCSGSGLVAPCGMLFHERFKHYHIGNLAETSFKELWKSQRYWDVLRALAAPSFDARTMCGTLCLQHNVNECLWNLVQNDQRLPEPAGDPPMHINFI